MKRSFSVNQTYDADVLVVGGGVAGVAAAVAAARQGVSVILCENGGFLGGTATKGLVGPFMTCYDAEGKEKIIRGFFEELVDRMVARGGAIPNEDCREVSGYNAYRPHGHKGVTPFSVEALKATLEDFCTEAGVRLLYHTTLVGCDTADNRITAAYVATVTGIEKITARQFIDCTGNAGLGAFAGAETFRGDEQGQVQTSSMFFTVTGVDKAMLDTHVFNAKDDREKYYMDIIEQGQKDGTFPCGTLKLRAFETIDDVWFVNMCQEDKPVNELNTISVTDAEISQRRQIQKMIAFLQAHIPPFANCRLVETASDIGIRESRRIAGKTVFGLDDVLTGKRFEDRIAVCANSIDMHQSRGVNYQPHSGGNYYIPLSCLIARDTDNLMMAGKTLSADRFAFAAVRVIPPCFAMGEAAGYTAALAVKNGTAPAAVPPKEVQKRILENGGYLG